ncbi:uncharacterized protein DEA37_0005611 [Paragonimus westermani]|uniref:Uncharacterized protein n=1 Tax=Paragonimus westermani TaxID=34504 RepID=A0A5J4N788_9TREM|nr:uncharacterized protein DEA37_0005611 [Paragonimus westermani]
MSDYFSNRFILQTAYLSICQSFINALCTFAQSSEFLTICLILLTRHHPLMCDAVRKKYSAMRQSLDRYRVELSNLLKEEITIDEKRLIIGPKSATIESYESTKTTDPMFHEC